MRKRIHLLAAAALTVSGLSIAPDVLAQQSQRDNQPGGQVGAGSGGTGATGGTLAGDRPGGVPSPVGAGAQNAHVSDVKFLITRITDAALSEGGNAQFFAYLSDQDRQRISAGQAQRQQNNDQVRQSVQRLNQAWQQKYNKPFDIGTRQLAFDDTSLRVVAADISHAARTAGERVGGDRTGVGAGAGAGVGGGGTGSTGVGGTSAGTSDASGGTAGTGAPGTGATGGTSGAGATGGTGATGGGTAGAGASGGTDATGGTAGTGATGGTSGGGAAAGSTGSGGTAGASAGAGGSVGASGTTGSAGASTGTGPGAGAGAGGASGTGGTSAGGRTSGTAAAGIGGSARGDTATLASDRVSVVIPQDQNAPTVVLHLTRDNPTDTSWKLDLPDTIDAQKLQANLQRHIGMVADQPDQLPASEDDAYVLVAHHVLAAITDASAADQRSGMDREDQGMNRGGEGMDGSSQEPRAPRQPAQDQAPGGPGTGGGGTSGSGNSGSPG